MDRYAVTNAHFQDFIEDTGYITEAERMDDLLCFTYCFLRR
ncbi:hypothetical protein [Peribacillus frigoritolerans]